ncbi:hypothetical protein BP5796_11114 [Coleophoma crateriformis]|uniref:NIMA interactive protein n=1 Tax=Coleophoma crateriformis TaxID=565419 RepID=A0A3D8QLZ0_9HELO|nr:hypothetical protein BP5796_11114 [Coleophoma crateriformis]
MEADNLRTASLYINNQLLSRGLLRNGQTIEFARPEKDPGGVDGTMGRIMGVVNDLILRRDRDAQQRESLAQTIRALKADALRQTTELERLSTKTSDASRRLGVAEATERSLKQQIRSAEQAARVLKEEMGRMKLLVGQTRAQCANEVRKRERVIEGMKKHIVDGGRARGSGKAPGVTTITVVPGIGAETGNISTISTNDTGYDLRMETNEFLTGLATGLSEENENLSSLFRRTVETLRLLSGCEKEDPQEGGLVIQMEIGYEALAAETDVVIEHLRNLLTNPSFVPLEEVEVREEEIIRLREGWEKMEGRWREAVMMMDGWRRRMARSGQTVNLEELKMGLSLSPLKPEESMKAFELSTLAEEAEDDTQADIDALDDSGIPGQTEPEFEEDEFEDSESSLFEEEPLEEPLEEALEEISEEISEEVTGETSELVDEEAPYEQEEIEQEEIEELDIEEDIPREQDEEAEEEEDEAEPVEEQLEDESSLHTASSFSLGPVPQLSPLKETDGNRVNSSLEKSQPATFSTIIEENTVDLTLSRAASPTKSSRAKATPRNARSQKESHTSQRSGTANDPSSGKSTSQTQVRAQRTTTSTTAPKPTPRRQPREPPTTKATPRRPASTRAAGPTPRIQLQPPSSSSRLPRPRDNLPPQQSPLTMATIAAKLAATEREADAARVRAKIKAAKLSRANAAASSKSSTAAASSREGEREQRSPVKATAASSSSSAPLRSEEKQAGDVREPTSTRKRKAPAGPRSQGGRAARRRSTLSPWELESLILGKIGGNDAEGSGSPVKAG